MTFLKKIIFSAAVLATFFACSKVDKKITPTPMYYSYFPLKVGLTRYYDVDSLTYLTIHRHVTYQMKEVYANSFVDNTGETVYRVERYTRPDTNSNWQVLDAITRRRTELEAFETDGNNTYLKLIFPVGVKAQWDPNKYNSTDSSHIFQASITDAHQPYQLNGLHFDSTAFVRYLDDSSIINIYHDNERYATGVGLITKYNKHLDIQPGFNGKPNDTSGYIYQQMLTGYSK
jgi:hypothetical protein